MTSRSSGNAADAGLNVGWIRRLGMKIKGPVELVIGHAVHHDHEHFQLLRLGIITLGDQVFGQDAPHEDLGHAGTHAHGLLKLLVHVPESEFFSLLHLFQHLFLWTCRWGRPLASISILP